MPRIHPEIRRRARQLRQPQTPAEQKLWRHLRARQVEGFKFRRQHPIGYFIVDFYCAAAKLVVEIDGPSHAEQAEYDQTRSDWLEEQGCRVVRYTNDDVKTNLDAVVEDILALCKKYSQDF